MPASLVLVLAAFCQLARASLAVSGAVAAEPPTAEAVAAPQRWPEDKLRVTGLEPPTSREHAPALVEHEFRQRLGATEREGAAVVFAAIPDGDSLNAASPPAGAGVPLCLLMPSGCESEEELAAWRGAKLSWIQEHVPGPHRDREMKLTVDQYDARRRELRLKQQAELQKSSSLLSEFAVPPDAAIAVVAAKTAKAGKRSGNRLIATLVMCVSALAIPALFSGFASLSSKSSWRLMSGSGRFVAGSSPRPTEYETLLDEDGV